jgi:hypothetical protein
MLRLCHCRLRSRSQQNSTPSAAACAMRLAYVLLGIAFVVLRYMARRWWHHLRISRRFVRSNGGGRQSSSSLLRAGSGLHHGHALAHAQLPGLPQTHSPPRSEAAKEAEAEQTSKQLKQHLPVGPQYLTRDELVDVVKPTDAQMALCALYSNRCIPARAKTPHTTSQCCILMMHRAYGASMRAQLFLQCPGLGRVPAGSPLMSRSMM